MIRRHLSPRIGRVSIIALAIAVLGIVAGALAYFTSSGNSTASAAIGALDTPSITTANAGAGTVSLSWSTVTNPASGAVKYYVTRDGGTPGGNCPTSAAPGTSTSCTDSGMSVGSHTYRVIAVWRTWTATSSASQVTVDSGALDHFTLSAPANATAGTAFNVTLTAKDTANNTVTSYTGTAHFASSDGQASLPSDYTFVSGDGGSHQFSVTLKTAGSKTVSATDTVQTGVAGTATISVAAGSPSKLVFTSSALSGTASSNSTLGPATVQEQDAFGNPTTTAMTVSLSSDSTGTVKFSTTSGGSSVTSVNIAAGSSSASFFYGDTKAGTPTITAAHTGQTSATQQETINAAGVNKFAFISTAVSGTASSTANLGPITIQEQDQFGNPTTTAESGISLSSTGTEVFSATQNGSAITSVSIPAGSSTASFYYGNRTAGTQTITAQRFSLSGTQQATISAAEVSKLVFTSSALSGSASATANLGPATVQEQDQFGNPTTTAETVNLSSSSSGSPVFAASLNGTAVTSVSIPAGSSSASFYYGDTKAGSATVTAQASGLTSATQNETVNAAAVNKLVFTTSALSGNTSTSANLGPATIQEQDQFGNPTTTSESGITLGSNTTGTPRFSLSQNGSAITTVSIPGGSSSVTFWYGDTKPGTPTITAAHSGLTSATQQETIQSVAQKLVITSTAVSGSASSTANLGAITVQEQDGVGNPTTSAETVTLSSNSTGTAVFSATQNGPSTTSVSIAAGSSSATFYYGDTKAGTPTITAAASGLTSGTQQETINAAAASSIAIVSGTPQTATISTAFANPFVAKVTDTFGNAVSGASVTFSGPSSGASGTFSNTGCTSRPQTYQCVVSTNASGQATSSTFTANSTSGKYNVSASAGGTNTVNYSLSNAVTSSGTTGTHTLTVPAHVTSLDFTINGAGGGGTAAGGTGGDGGSATGTLSIPDSASATTFTVKIGAGGGGTSSENPGSAGAGFSNGGAGGTGGGSGSANGGGGGGGGASALYTGASTPIVVAGGGAGGGGRTGGGNGGDGSGGALTNPGTSSGANGGAGSSGGAGFGGITTTSGSLPFTITNTAGAAGTGGSAGATAGGTGAGCTAGHGGNGTGTGNSGSGAGGGGGGGLACGGGAAGASGSNASASGGGGGSGYTGGTASFQVTVGSVGTAGNGGGASTAGGDGSVTFIGSGITLS